MTETDVAIEEREEDGVAYYAIKISSSFVEFNVTIPGSEIDQLRQVLSTDWASGALRLGTSAGAAVFWCTGDDDTLSVLIGHDDQTWDIGLTLPAKVVPQILDSLPR